MMAPTPQSDPSYFEQRMHLLGISKAENKVRLWQSDPDQPGKNKLLEVPIFRQSEKGIDILVYTLQRHLINYKPDNSRWSKSYCLTRLKDPIVRKDGSVQKYYLPKGQGTYPFFHPSLLEAFEEQKTIDTLFLTEGFFKAFKGCKHGIPVIGLSSITHLKDKETGALHPDIIQLMQRCRTKRMVWLTDGDCLDITGKEITEGMDLYKRPKNFYTSCENFKQLLDDYDVDKYFFHIDTDYIVQTYKQVGREGVKGLDDLLCSFPDKIDEIVSDIHCVSLPGPWFIKHNITSGTRKIHQYFHLTNVNDFYLFQVERRPEIKDKEFVFNGTRYKFEEKDGECKIVTPAEAKKYIRVGDNYYKFVEKVNQEGKIEKALEKRLKSTIVDDHGAKFIQHIIKYEAFCNVPDHINYQPAHYNCFNVYFPFEHEPELDVCTEADCPFITAFFQHIFGQREVAVRQPDGSTVKTPYYQLGLDLVQLLYQKPTQRLPILCLVSKENETGKSTFFDLMKAIFTNNATVVGNADLADDFNSFWATKLLIMCDETKIDKQTVVEKVKSLTFARKIGMNAKGKDKVEIDFFGHFMFNSNNEDNFIYANEEDLRYWVIKVPRIKNRNPDFLDNMLSEIPCFLSLLNNRKMVAPRSNRMWFDEQLLKTDALKKVIEANHSMVKKELRHYLHEMFLTFGIEEILMTCRAIRENFFRNKEENYIEKVLKEEFKMLPVQKFEYKGKRYDSEDAAIDAVMADKFEMIDNAAEAATKITKVTITIRHQYPRLETIYDPATRQTERIAVWVKDIGRPYKFLRKDFVEEHEKVEVPKDLMFLAGSTPSNGNGQSGYHQNTGSDDLPFSH